MRLQLPASFPQSDYTPFGYLDNPYHSAVYNRSGLLRTVPPLGFGFWRRAMPWPYGIDVEGNIGYLSFLYLSLHIDGLRFHTADDFRANGVELVSRYHTKSLMSYDWSFGGLNFSAKYLLANEHALVCFFEVENSGAAAKSFTLHATNIYGYPGEMYWGRDGVTSRYHAERDAAISKVWAYGDVFILGANQPSAAYKSTASPDEWEAWASENDLSRNDGAVTSFEGNADGLYSLMSYNLTVPAGASESLVLCLARNTNEPYALRSYTAALGSAYADAASQLAADDAFYAEAPLLTGDWPARWKHGWVYDYETLRMTVRLPVGIFRHPWDGMQIDSPRAVLGETSIDMFCLSYANPALAKEVLYGIFADAPAPNVPCTREDGSMNMIGESGSECGTAPNWGFPFLVINSIYRRTGDREWIRGLYPYLKSFIEWWLANRTDADGWFHADNSWESGQDGSKRFLQAGEGAAAHNVRTVDIEAAMAQAMALMVDFAEVAGASGDVAYWQRMAEERATRTRAMYFDGWFRDVNADDNQPIILPDYFDVMMLSPLAVGLATPEQVEAIKPKFEYFRQNPRHWLEWPSFMLPFSEAAWRSGLRGFIAEVVTSIGERIYPRLDSRETDRVADRYKDRLPKPFSYRIPGVSNEFWPLNLDESIYRSGGENYGWGATFPTLVIRNLIGFREGENGFVLAPSLPPTLFEIGKQYGITNLRWQDFRFDVSYEVLSGEKLRIRLTSQSPTAVTITDENGNVIAQGSGQLTFEAANSGVHRVSL
jgi:hypothetical protein